MPIYTVSDLKAALGQGAKVDKFTIELGVPSGDGTLTLGADGPVLIKATSFPEKTLGQIEVWEQGRKLILPGDTAFSNTWTVTFYQTVGHDIRKMFIKWMDAIDNFEQNKHVCTPDMFMVEGKVNQLGCEGNETASYLFHNMFPSVVGEVTVDGSQPNQIQEFTVTFTYSHWDSI